MKNFKLNYASVILCCITVLNVLLYNEAKAQIWSQLGPGAGGQERAVYVYSHSGLLDFFVGSDVSGVWRASNVDPLLISDPNQYVWVYISNHEITRFINKFFNPAITSTLTTDDYLFTGYRNGIDRINLTIPASAMIHVWDQDNAWVSDMYMGDEHATTHNHLLYFTTGTTRVTDEPGNNKDNTVIHDFYFGYMNQNQDAINAGLVGYDLGGLSGDKNVYCMNVDDNQTSTDPIDDKFLIGTENGLYDFLYTDFSSLSVTSSIPIPIGSGSYKATSITQIGITDQYLVTIYDLGIFTYDVSDGDWLRDASTAAINLVVELFAQDKGLAYQDVAGTSTIQQFTKLMPIRSPATGLPFGWLLFNEKNLNSTRTLYYGAFYAPDNGNGIPTTSWKVLDTWAGSNSYGWNNSPPASNINGALVLSDNRLLIGKNGNILITQQPLNSSTPLGTDWQQIYTNEDPANSGSCDDLFEHRGYVNTAPKCVFEDEDKRIWMAQSDRLMWYADDGGLFFKEVPKDNTGVSSCIHLNTTGAATGTCSTLPLSDCFFVTKDPSNPSVLYAGVGEGNASNQGLGLIMKLDPAISSNEWKPVGTGATGLCGDPVKLLFYQTDMYMLFNQASGTQQLFHYNTAMSKWDIITLFTESINDAVIGNDGNLFVIRAGSNANEGVYRFTGSGIAWAQQCSTLTGTPEKCTKLCILPYSGGYKVICGLKPTTAATYSESLKEVYNSANVNICSNINITNSACIGGTLATDIFSHLYFDNLDANEDGGINFIEVNNFRHIIYVSTVHDLVAGTSAVTCRIYRSTYDPANGNIEPCWTEITGNMPNKAVKFINTTGNDKNSCGEEIHCCVRGLGAWDCKINNGFNASSGTFNSLYYDVPSSFNVTGILNLNNCDLSIAAGVSITVGTGATLNLNGCRLFACGDMWQGIIINNGGAVNVTNSKIDDAIVAISSGGGAFTLLNSTFDNNRQAVYAHDADFSASEISGCFFDYTKLPMFDAGLPESNIFLSNATNLFIGYDASNFAPNVFTKAVNGIFARNSDVHVCNSQFTNLGADFTDESGVIVRGGWGINANSTSAVPNFLTVDQYTNAANTWPSCEFNNCRTGISVFGQYDVNIKHNFMDNCFVGVNFSNNRQRTVNIIANRFNNFVIGLNEYDDDATITINNNLFNTDAAGMPLAYLATSTFGSHAINMRQVMSIGSRIQIHGNRINNTFSGMTLLDLKGVNTGDVNIGGTNTGTADLDNHIWFKAPNGSNNRQYGIRTYQCTGKGVLIAENKIERDATQPSQLAQQDLYIGIFNERATDILVHNNYTINMGTDHVYYGNCLGTDIRCNKMESSFQGFKFISATLTTASKYGSDIDVTDNHWEGAYLSNTNERITGAFAGNPLDWYHRNSVVPSNNYCPYYHSSPLVSVTPKTAANPQTSNCEFYFNGDDKRDDMLRIAGDSVPFDEFPDENVYYNDLSAYRNLKDDSTLMYSGSPGDLYLQQWYAAQQNSNIGKYADVNSYIAAKNKQAALIANLSIVDTTIILQNLRTATDIYLKYFFNADSMPVLDSVTYETLLAIALQNGIEGGEGVYMARAMLNIDVEDNISIARFAHPAATINNSSREQQQFKIFPNPSDATFTLEYEIGINDKVSIVIQNCLGQTVDHINLDNSSTYLNFNLSDYGSGMYFYKLFNNSILIKTGKLMLTK
ncbi:MAG: T9SS type A sorting domain-containing protein [Bacteroidia bacterium]